jgi:RNA polymerase sigma-70 factor (ECF subfamily)
LQVHDWQLITEKYGPRVWQIAFRLLGNRTDAADCFQETFLGALELSRHQRVRNLQGMLVRLATTRAIDRLRQRSRQEQNRTLAREGPSVAWGNDCDPAHHAETNELAGQLRRAIGELPPQEAKAFCLRYFSEMSYRQIAKELDIQTGAAGVLLHRAKARLRQRLAAHQLEMNEISP